MFLSGSVVYRVWVSYSQRKSVSFSFDDFTCRLEFKVEVPPFTSNGISRIVTWNISLENITWL